MGLGIAMMVMEFLISILIMLISFAFEIVLMFIHFIVWVIKNIFKGLGWLIKKMLKRGNNSDKGVFDDEDEYEIIEISDEYFG